MKRKYFIAVAILAIGLLLSGLALAWKNKDALLGKMQANQAQWLEIKPRAAAPVASRKTNDKISPAKNAAKIISPEKNSTSANEKTSVSNSANADQPAGAAVKTKPLPIAWCPQKNGPAAANQVIINEVAWMGTKKSFADEWIELKNISGAPASLAGWQLQNKKATIKVAFDENDAIAPGGFYLLERTDDSTVPDVSADKIYFGSLANAGEAIYLFDAACSVQDRAAAVSQWPAGDNNTKQTMERRPNLLWQTSKDPGGTPRAENSIKS